MRPSEAAFDFGLRLGSFLAGREDFAAVALDLFVDSLVEDETFLLFAVLGIFKGLRLVPEVGCEPALGDGSRFRFLDCDFDANFGSSTSVVGLVICGVDWGVSVGGSSACATTAVSSTTG